MVLCLTTHKSVVTVSQTLIIVNHQMGFHPNYAQAHICYSQ